MSEKRLLGLFCLGIAVLAVVSGPLVGPVDLTQDRRNLPSDGTANVTVESVPTEGIYLQQNRFVPGRYHLVAPPAVVRVTELTGNPLIRYSIDIPGIDHAVSTRYQGAEYGTGRMELQFAPIGITKAKITDRRYDAVISVWVHSGTRQIDLVQKEVVVEVRT